MNHEYYDLLENVLDGNRASILYCLPGFEDFDSCPACNSRLLTTDLASKCDMEAFLQICKDSDRYLRKFEAITCVNCPWWQLVLSVNDAESIDWGWTRYAQSMLKRFDVSSATAPIATLADYISNKGEAIFEINDRKMEELVAAVLSEHFACEVKHCGRSGDGNVDLLLIMTDELVPVQVKRRTRPGVLESVQTIREMLGTMFVNDYRRAMIVSTADRFSPSGTCFDHIYVRGLGRPAAMVLKDTPGSDHFPVVVDLTLNAVGSSE